MGRPKKTTEQQNLVAAALYAGDAPRTACERAGYSKSTIKAFASRICKSDVVQARLREIARNIQANELTDLGRARIKEKLTSGERNNTEMLRYIRTAAELEGQLGGPAELHLYNHQTLPPKVQAMLEEKMAEIIALRERGDTVEMLPEPSSTQSPAPAEPPEPVQQTEPITLTVEERQNRYLEFQAGLMRQLRN
jgi:hypothetical protein